MKLTEVYAIIENKKCNSAWNRGVNLYALELLEDMYLVDMFMWQDVEA